MKKNVRKIICVVLVLSLVVLALAMLSACNKKQQDMGRDTQKDAQAREASCNTMLNNIMKVASKDWNSSMTDQEIVSLDDAGEYVSNYYWAKFFVDTLNHSELRTMKVESVNAFIESELKKRDEKKEDAVSSADEEQAEVILSSTDFILDFISSSGLLAQETASITFAIITSLLDNAQTVYSAAIEKCNNLLNPSRTDIEVTDKARISIQKEIADLERSREYIVNTFSGEVKKKLLQSLNEGKPGFEVLFETVFDFGGLLSTGQFKSVIDGGKGAMSNLSKNDILNFLDSIRIKLANMYMYFDDNEDDVEKLKDTFDSISSITNTFIAKNKIVYSALSIIRYVNTVIDVLPILTDLLLNCWTVFENDETFIDDIITYFIKANKSYEENSYILMARAFMEYKKNTGDTVEESKEYSLNFIDTIDKNIAGDIYSSCIYIFLEFVMDSGNEGKYFDVDTEGKTAEEIKQAKDEMMNKLTRPLTAVFIGLGGLRKTYEQFLTLDSVKKEDVTYRVNTVVDMLTDMGIVSEELKHIATIPDGNTDPWFTSVYNLLESKIKDELIPQAIRVSDTCMPKYFEEIYVPGVLEDMANSNWVTHDDGEEQIDPDKAVLEEKVKNLNLFKMLLVIPVFAKIFR